MEWKISFQIGVCGHVMRAQRDSKVSKTLFNQGGPFSSKLVSIGGLHLIKKYTKLETIIADSPLELTVLLKEAKMPSGSGFLLLLVPDCLHGK